MDTQELKQINLKLSPALVLAAESYAKNFGFRNVQELAATSMREKIFQQNQFDETFTDEEIELIDNLIATTKKENMTSEEELNKILLE
jgi:hypothetical protein